PRASPRELSAMPGVIHTGPVIDFVSPPTCTVTFTRSVVVLLVVVFCTPSSAAVLRLTRISPSHVTFVTGSGNSWSQPLLFHRPSPRRPRIRDNAPAADAGGSASPGLALSRRRFRPRRRPGG